ncbi:hypothetical protein ACHAWT_009324 [Skeletonema menzelii]
MSSKLHDDNLLHIWREEQHTIASQVIIPPESSSVVVSQTNGTRYVYLSPYTSSNINGQTTTECDKNYLLIGGVDVSFSAVDNEDAVAVYVILKYDKSTLSNNDPSPPPEVVYRSHKFYKLTTPYIPSYLAFREIDPIMELITEQCNHKPHLTPNVILVDGNGQWHDRRAGLACAVGVKCKLPTIGVGKTFYSLDHEMEKSDVLRDVKNSVQSWYDDHCKQEQGRTESDNMECRGEIVVDNESIPLHSNKMRVKRESPSPMAYEEMLVKLHQVCSGLAIPMRSGMDQNDIVLAHALVGHGGNNLTNNNGGNCNKSSKPARGSKNPIYVSCGSHVSLLEAVSLVAWTSVVRIPEPIREADLHGRQLLRDQNR